MSGSYPEFRWRDAGLDDAALLSRLNVAGWRQTYPGVMPETLLARLETSPSHDPASWRRRLERQAPDRWTRILLAPDPVGFVWFGRAALAESFRTLEAIGLTPIVIWVFEVNRRAQDFYRHLGGRPLGERALVFTEGGREFWETAYGWPAGFSGERTPPPTLTLPRAAGGGDKSA